MTVVKIVVPQSCQALLINADLYMIPWAVGILVLRNERGEKGVAYTVVVEVDKVSR